MFRLADLSYQSNWDTSEGHRGGLNNYARTDDIHKLALSLGNWDMSSPGFRGLFLYGLSKDELKKKKKEKNRQGKNIQITPPLAVM